MHASRSTLGANHSRSVHVCLCSCDLSITVMDKSQLHKQTCTDLISMDCSVGSTVCLSPHHSQQVHPGAVPPCPAGVGALASSYEKTRCQDANKLAESLDGLKKARRISFSVADRQTFGCCDRRCKYSRGAQRKVKTLQKPVDLSLRSSICSLLLQELQLILEIL